MQASSSTTYVTIAEQLIHVKSPPEDDLPNHTLKHFHNCGSNNVPKDPSLPRKYFEI
jgi:hypothetical protein